MFFMKKLLFGFSFFLIFWIADLGSSLQNLSDISKSPNWMDESINKELKNIPNSSIKGMDIDKTLFFSVNQKKLGFSYLILKISISNNIPEFFTDSEETLNLTRGLILKDFFCKLCQKYKLPDLELLFSLHDAFDFLPQDLTNEKAEYLKIPIFVFAKNKRSINRILFPDFEAFDNNQLILNCNKAAKKFSWKSKKEKVFFRGATTNKCITEDNFWENPRFSIVYLSLEMPELVDASFTYITENYKSFPHDLYSLSPYVSVQDHFAYKYLIDIDGNSCAYSRCRWIMLSNSVLLKCQSDNVQWYYDLLKPFENYIPINEDLSNLESQVEWLKTHDRKAREISKKSESLGRAIFNSEAVELYVVKLLYRYSLCLDMGSMKD